MTTKLNCGVYCIENLGAGHKYFGSSSNLKSRLCNHYSALKHGTHTNKLMQSEYDIYGKDNFLISVLLYCDLENRTLYEQLYLNKFESFFNTHKFSDSPRGCHHTAEQNEKIRQALLGKPRSEEIIEKIRTSKHGRGNGHPMTEEIKKKISGSMSGKKNTLGHILSEEHKLRISQSNIGRTGGMKGKKHTEETKEKMRKSYLIRLEKTE